MKNVNYLKEDSPQKKGRKQEKIARQTINSGTFFFDKGDLEVKDSDDQYRVDTKKVVLQKSYTLSLKEIEKFYHESSPQTPVYLIYIGDFCLKAIVERVKTKEKR
jgi:hypothetical protein